MSTLIIDLLFALVCMSMGFGAAWFLKRSSLSNADAARSNLAEQAIARLQELTRRISTDVVEHNSRVQEISDSLTGWDPSVDDFAAAVHELIDLNGKMQTQLSSAEKRLQDQAREIETHVAEARTDALTGLGNRRVFNSELERGYCDYQRRGRPLSAMIIDVDQFKDFNDMHGHQAGDEVLRAVGRVLMKNTLPEHVVCRYGGEEFAIIYPGSTIADAAPLAEAARRAIGENLVEFEGKQLSVTACAGIAQLLPSESVDDLIRRADEALYASKEEGRDRAHGHDGETFYPLEDLLAAVEEAAAQYAAKTVSSDEPILELENELKQTPTPTLLEEKFERLTGLSDMTSFREDLNRRLSEAKRSGTTISMLVAQIDNWEEIRSKHGTRNTNMVLRAAAQFFKATMRDMDHLACDAEDTFALMLPTAKSENALKVAERLRGAVYRCKLPLGGKPFQFTMSFGVAQAQREDCAETLINRCKAAHCQAIQLGGNQCYADADTAELAAAPV